MSAAAAAQNWGRQTAECSCGGRSSEILALRRYILRHNSHADALDKGLMAPVLRQKAWYLLPPRITCQAVNSVVRLLGSQPYVPVAECRSLFLLQMLCPRLHTHCSGYYCVSSLLHRLLHLFCVYYKGKLIKKLNVPRKSPPCIPVPPPPSPCVMLYYIFFFSIMSLLSSRTLPPYPSNRLYLHYLRN